MKGGPTMMRFNELDQQMLSYCMGMQQMMRRAGNTDMAAGTGCRARSAAARPVKSESAIAA